LSPEPCHLVTRDEPVGLLAAAGRFPITFAEKARQVGLRVACVGLRGLSDPALAGLVWRFHWSGPIQVGRMIRLFRREGARRLVMCGKVYKDRLMYRPWKIFALRPDWTAVRVFYLSKRRDNKDHSLLLSMIDEFAKHGLTFASALDLCPELLVKPGVLTRRQPSAAESADVAFGWEMAKEMARLEVGQSVAVKDRSVLAVEAVEGTDRAILRAGELCRVGGFTVVKVAKAGHDMRFDVPTVGTATVRTMHQARARVLAIEAGRTILLDQAETITLANELGITVVALTG
jgi:DUF1009 family protein